MGGSGVSSNKVKDRTTRLSKNARSWVALLARVGFAAKGVVYVIIGVLAGLAALDAGGKATDARGALTEIVRRPFGRSLLVVVAAGLAGYAIWRFVQAVKDTEQKGSDAKGLAVRTGYAFIGLIYVGLGYSAVSLILGSGAGQGSDESSKERTARLLSLPFGQWLVGAAGLGFIAFALYQCYKAYTAKFCEKIETGAMAESSKTLVTRAGQVGLTARGVVFGVIGVFLIQAALRAKPNEARGLSGALRALEQQPYGKWVMGVVALGLVTYGLFMFVMARYSRIKT
ncbi:MAG: DUF1206 domain-containing protein [Rubrivivax sp.]|nr:DUF1206 domain-containing protein [Pyrinomonadaceae bacterium]